MVWSRYSTLQRTSAYAALYDLLRRRRRLVSSHPPTGAGVCGPAGPHRPPGRAAAADGHLRAPFLRHSSSASAAAAWMT